MKEAELKHLYFFSQLVFSVCAMIVETRTDAENNEHEIMTEEVGVYPPSKRTQVRVSIYLSIYGPTALCWTLTAFKFLDLLHGRTPWTGDQPVARSLPAHRTTQTQNKRTQASMPRAGEDSSYLRPRGHYDWQVRESLSQKFALTVTSSTA
jgi:hypothetical protein